MNETFIKQELHQKNKVVFDFVFQYYYSGLCAYAESIIMDENAVEDIVQELFVAIWIKSEQLKITGSLKNYLFSSIKNRCFDYLKHQKVKLKSVQYFKTSESLNENSPEKIRKFEKFGVPWNNVIVFVGHSEPEDPKLFDLIHQKGALCIQGTSRNLDRIYTKGEVSKIEDLKNEYHALFQKGVDIIETDIPVPLSRILPDLPKLKSAKTKYLKLN